MRRAAKRDTIHNDIAAALSAVGCLVFDLSRMGAGCPDLLVGRSGVTYLIEVKAPNGQMTLAQKEFHARWRGRGGALHIVRSVDEALRAVGALAAAPSNAASQSKSHNLEVQQQRIDAVLRELRSGKL